MNIDENQIQFLNTEQSQDAQRSNSINQENINQSNMILRTDSNWLIENKEVQKLDFKKVENLEKLCDLLITAVDKISDPENDSIIKELFEIKHFFSMIPDDKASMKYI